MSSDRSFAGQSDRRTDSVSSGPFGRVRLDRRSRDAGLAKHHNDRVKDKTDPRVYQAFLDQLNNDFQADPIDTDRDDRKYHRRNTQFEYKQLSKDASEIRKRALR